MTNPFSWAVNQLTNIQPVERKVPKFNPRPPGVIQAGSASEAVLQILRSSPQVFFTHGRLMELTGRSHAAISWALKFLREQDLVKTIQDGARDERWLRYAAKIGDRNVEISNHPRTKAGDQRLASNEAAMPATKLQGLSEVRRGGNQSLPPVDCELRAVSGGCRTATGPQTLAWPEGHQQALHAGELRLDRTHASDEPAPVLPQGHRRGTDLNRRRSGAPTRPAAQKHRTTPLGGGFQPGAAKDGKALQEFEMADTPGTNVANTRVDETFEPEPHGDCEANRPGNANRSCVDAWSAHEELDPINPETMKALEHEYRN